MKKFIISILSAALLAGLSASTVDAKHRGGKSPPTGGGAGCTIVSVSESGANTFVGNPNGSVNSTTVGTVAITTSGTCGAASWAISDSTNYKIAGTSVQTNSGSVPVGTYSGITATATIAGATNSPATTNPFTIIGTGITNVVLSNTAVSPSAPPGTVVGAITVPALGPAFTGTLSITGTNGALYALSSPTLPSNLITTASPACASPPCTHNINLVATQLGVGASPKTVPYVITSSSGTTLTTFTFRNNSAGTMPAGHMVSFGQAFPRSSGGFNPASNCVKVRDASTHNDLVYQLDENSTRRENSDDNTTRHLVWSVQWPSTLEWGNRAS